MKLMKKIFIPIFIVVGFFAFSKNVNASNVPEYIGEIKAKSEIVTDSTSGFDVYNNVAKLEFKALKNIYYMTVDFSVTSNSGFEDSTIYSIDRLASSSIDLSAPTGQAKSDMDVNDIAAAYTSVTVESATSDAFKYATIVIEGTDYYIETIVYDIVNNSVVSVNKKFDKIYYVIDKIYEDYEFDTNGGSSEEISFCKYISTDPYIYKEFKLKTKDIESKELDEIYEMIDAILEEIEKENEVGIYVDDDKMTQDVLDIIKEEKYVATIEVSWLYEEYEDEEDIPDDFEDKVTASWIFNGSKITSTDYEIDLGIKRNAGENIETIKKLVSDVTKAIFLDFAHSGKLPEGTQVKVYVGDKFDDKTMLKLSLFNPKTGKLELTETKLEVVDGYVVFDLEHCSEYVLEIDDTVETTNNALTSSLNYKAYAMISVLSLLIIGISLIKLKEQA